MLRATIMTITVCWLASTCGRTWRLQTICVTGSGESFSNCNSTIATVSSKSLRGNRATRRKTCSEGSQAMFSLRCHRFLQSLVMILAGKDSAPRVVCSRLKTKPRPRAPNCHSRRSWAPTCRTLQEWIGAFLAFLTTGRGAAFGAASAGNAVAAFLDFDLRSWNKAKPPNPRHSARAATTG